MDNWFEELSAMRKEWVEITRKNNFDEGIRHSTVEKYPDPVHFVYELLQNAEDQDATEACFELSANCLIFYHNGNPFTKVDVENITGIGNSDKTPEANKIGRFGIGFKSIFAITERPKIYTILEGKPFAFAIEELVIPIYISEKQEQTNHFNTRFVFPFIQSQEKILYAKIKDRLTTLGSETMLFLRNLRSIEWKTETEEGIYLRDVQGSRHELLGESRQNGQLQRSNAVYLMFTRKVSLSNSDRELDVRIAFRLDETGKIVAVPDQKLVVYFPTEQETGLNFLVHGPFLLTDNRANIKNDNEVNNRLIQECAILLSESIQQIKEMGLLTVDFLSLLPICKEHIPVQFLSLYNQVFQTLKRYPLLPTLCGMFASAIQVKLARGTELRELVNDQQLSALYEEPFPIYWLPSEITVDRTPDLYRYLTKDLDVEVIDPNAFVQKLEASFLEKQTDIWLVKLYTFLSKQSGLNTIVRGKPILRREDNIHVSPFKRRSYMEKNDTPNAYLLRQGDSQFPLVKKSLLVDDTVYDFLKRIGLSEPDVVDEVLRFTLPSYIAHEIALDDEVRNKQDLSSIQEALQHKEHRRYAELVNKLKETPFLQASNAKTSVLDWKSPRMVHYRTQELLTWLEGNEQAWFIPDSLSKSLMELNIPIRLRPIATWAEGSTGYVTIKDGYGNHQRGLHGFDPNARLYGLQHALAHITSEKAKMLWDILLEYRHLIKGVVETSTQQTFVNAIKEEKFSQIGRLCNENAWLPDNHGNFHIPGELFLGELSEAFEKNSYEAKELAIKLGMRKEEEVQLADKLGIPHDLIVLIKEDPETIREWYREQERKKVLLPSSIANNVERRIEKATEAAFNAPTKIYKEVSINRRISAVGSEVKSYLRNHHTNVEGQIICQLCNRVMPFTLPDGEEYFEAYQYMDLEKEYEANHLALCPNCAAEFEHACQTDDNERAERILNVDATGDENDFVVPLDMPVHRQLRFTQRHLVDLQAATRQWLESEPEYIK